MTVLIGLAGDIMIGRLVNEVIRITSYEYPWGNAVSLLKKTDINIANLETALTKSEKAAEKVFNFKADPDRAKVLEKGNIHIVNLANNHIMDFCEEGLTETIEILDRSGIRHTGAGRNIREASEPVICKKAGVSVGVIGITDNEPRWKAGKNRPGTNYIKIGNKRQEGELKKALGNIDADIKILSIHWGPNMRLRPSRAFVRFAREMSEAGMDVLHGHSAHVFQGIEARNKKAIFYDTGDFVDDYAVDPYLRNDLSFFYILKANKSGISEIEAVPVKISMMQVNLAAGSEGREAVKRLKTLSFEFGTKIEGIKKAVIKM